MRLTRIVLSTALALLVLSGCASVHRHCDDRDFSEVDKVIATGLFGGTIVEYPDGSSSKQISERWPSSFGIDQQKAPVEWACTMRAQAAAKMHRKLLEEDPDYRRRWNAVVREVLPLLNRRTSLPDGERILYPRMLAACIYHDIFARLGPPTYEDDPFYNGKDDPRMWGVPTSPFFFIERLDEPSWPASVQPFHYCSGTGGLTVTGGDAEPHVRAWKWLMAHDERFRADWERVLAVVAPEARRVDPLDTAAARRVTDHWRRLLLEGGEESLAARIEARVREEAGGQPPGDEGP